MSAIIPRASQTSGSPAGLSAFEVAVSQGYAGTVNEWILSLQGEDGLSAYALAVQQGYVGSLNDWILSLQGLDGLDGVDGVDGVAGANGLNGLDGANGANGVDGANGANGLSAYQLAVADGFVGTVSEWILSLQGADADIAILDDLADVVLTSVLADQGLAFNAVSGKWENSYHPASAIINVPAGSLLATDVQAALNELDTEKAALAGAAFTGVSSVTANSASTALTITQTGAGNVLEVLDAAGDATPFVIDANGNVGIGKSPESRLDIMATDNVITNYSLWVENAAMNYGTGYGAYGMSNRNIGGIAANVPYTFDIGDAAIFKTNDVERMRIASNGLVTLAAGSGLSISRTAVTAPGVSDGNVYSGTYTPTLGNILNTSARTAYAMSYSRSGNTVTGAGSVSITATAIGRCVVTMSVPVASDFTDANARDAGGAVLSKSTSSPLRDGGHIRSNPSANTLEIDIYAGSTSATEYAITYQYKVLP